MRIFFFFEAYYRNEEIVYQHNIAENMIKYGDPNYVETFKDSHSS